MALARVRLLRGWVDWQTGQPQPTAGTPTLVPVPNRIIWPRMSVVTKDLGTVEVGNRGDERGFGGGSRNRKTAVPAEPLLTVFFRGCKLLSCSILRREPPPCQTCRTE